jgi:Tn3 transposase DDE domain
MVASIILWNTVYLERAIGALRQQGRQVDEGLLKHVAPVHWNHINLTGDYSWRQNKRVEKGGFRPLRVSAEPIAVGMPIAENPPHRSRRA